MTLSKFKNNLHFPLINHDSAKPFSSRDGRLGGFKNRRLFSQSRRSKLNQTDSASAAGFLHAFSNHLCQMWAYRFWTEHVACLIDSSFFKVRVLPKSRSTEVQLDHIMHIWCKSPLWSSILIGLFLRLMNHLDEKEKFTMSRTSSWSLI